MTPLLRRWVSLCLLAVLTIAALLHLTKTRPASWQWPNGLLITGYGTRQQLQKPIAWNTIRQNYPVSSMIPLPSGAPITIPEIQAIFATESEPRKAWRLKRLKAVRDAFVHSWRGYTKYAWLHDEVSPISKRPKDHFGGWGASLIDSLDTLWIMGMEKDFAIAVAALHKIDFTTTHVETLNVFETTIRYLGGLLSAHDLTNGKYPVLMEKAVELGEMLYLAFDTPNRMPVTRWNWKQASAGTLQSAHTMTLSAEIGSLTVEFTRLSQLTADPKYFDAVQRISDRLEAQQNLTSIPGLWPIVFNAYTMDFAKGTTFTFGGMADSMYEYIPKVRYFICRGIYPS
jgi:mannosyl-oligosaccharide alpha-1,2-mannosidase